MSDETVPAPPKKATTNDVAQLVLTAILFASLLTMIATQTVAIRYAAQAVGGACMFLRLPVHMYLAGPAPFYRVVLSVLGFIVAMAGLARLFGS